MPTLAAKTQIQREPGFLYFVGKDGAVWKTAMMRGNKRKTKALKVTNQVVTKKPGNLYFLDKKGNVSFAKMHRN